MHTATATTPHPSSTTRSRLYDVDYWYRHESDADRTIRSICQMSAAARDEAQVRTEIAGLQAQGYEVQKVVMRLVCPTCDGRGRIGRIPKGMRKAKIATLPNWRLVWTSCGRCMGDGWLEATEL